jgi:hypothetical protein
LQREVSGFASDLPSPALILSHGRKLDDSVVV